MSAAWCRVLKLLLRDDVIINMKQYGHACCAVPVVDRGEIRAARYCFGGEGADDLVRRIFCVISANFPSGLGGSFFRARVDFFELPLPGMGEGGNGPLKLHGAVPAMLCSNAALAL